MPDEVSNRGGPDGAWYSYAIIRVVPRVERGEFLNAGVILFARTAGFLEARVHLDEDRLRAVGQGESLRREVLRHLQVTQELAAVQECLFVPFAITPFTPDKVLRWRRPLVRSLRRPRWMRHSQEHQSDCLLGRVRLER